MDIIKKIRIGNIELRPIKESVSAKYIAEIVKWYPNPHYKHEDDYNWDEEKEWATAKNSNCRIHKSCFANPESCYVLSFIDDFKEGEEPDIIECGSRVITLNNSEDLQDYIKVCELMFNYIRGN